MQAQQPLYLRQLVCNPYMLQAGSIWSDGGEAVFDISLTRPPLRGAIIIGGVS